MSTAPGDNLRRRLLAGARSSRRVRPRAPALLGALALAGAPFLLLPSAAPAARLREQACSLVMEAQSGRLDAGEAAVLGGTLSCPNGTQAGEQTIGVYARSAGTPGVAQVASVTPEASGAFHFQSEPLQANTIFLARSGRTHSRRVAVRVAPVVSVSGPPTGTPLSIAAGRRSASAGTSNTITLQGTVSPAQAGARVVLQRAGADREENWNPIATGEVGEDGAYSITHTFGIAGSATVRVVVRAPGLLPGISQPLTYQIARRQNPALTIQASARPLTYGQQVTLSGTVAGAAGTSLTLLASTGAGAPAVLATTASDAQGDYAFAPLSPQQDTSYRVTDAHAKSTVLFETVKPNVVAQVSDANAHTGEQVAFTGTVAPASAGETVQLQREDSDGLAFHDVASAPLQAGGSFSIETTLTGSGAQVFRAIVPRAGGLQASSSEPIDVQVAGAEEESIEPEAPGAPLEAV